MCVDFIDLNRAYPKDFYPLPNIDKLVEAASGYQYLSFMDTYLGYNQIHMHPKDEKTTFMINDPTYCYLVMPFRLKNVGATYQRLIDKVFQEQISRNIEVYVDDMGAKTPSLGNHCANLEEMFM